MVDTVRNEAKVDTEAVEADSHAIEVMIEASQVAQEADSHAIEVTIEASQVAHEAVTETRSEAVAAHEAVTETRSEVVAAHEVVPETQTSLVVANMAEVQEVAMEARSVLVAPEVVSENVVDQGAGSSLG